MEDEFRKQPVLVTGASGFIGSHVTRRLVELDSEVHILVRASSTLWRLQNIPKDRLTIWKVDLRNFDELTQVVHKIQPRRVFHLAAAVNSDRNFKLFNQMIDVNVKGTWALLEALRETSVECILNAGTCEEYGDIEAPFFEYQRESPVSPYSASKTAATYFCQMAYRVSKIPVITVRPFLTYGPYQVSGMLIPSLIEKCLNGEREFELTPGEQTREFNYVSDIVEALLQISVCPDLLGETVNIGNGKEYKIIDVARKIISLSGSSLKLNAGALDYREGEVFHFYSSTEKLRQFIDSTPYTPLDQGLQQTIQWYTSHLKKQSVSPIENNG